jgi:hypothetical protein
MAAYDHPQTTTGETPWHHRASAGRLAALLATVLAAACASVAFEPDRNARAPRLEGFGTRATTAYSVAPAARELFEQGLALHGPSPDWRGRAHLQGRARGGPAVCRRWPLGGGLDSGRTSTAASAATCARQCSTRTWRCGSRLRPRPRACAHRRERRCATATPARRETALMAVAVCGAPATGQNRAHRWTWLTRTACRPCCRPAPTTLTCCAVGGSGP